MNSITKIIIGIVGLALIGLITYYVVTNEKNTVTIEKPITNPSRDTITTANVIQDTIFNKIKSALNIDGEEFTEMDTSGVYVNTSKDKMLMINEDVWKKLIRKTQKKFPQMAEDCNMKYKMSSLKEYKFVGLLTYLVESKKSKTTVAYSAIEIRNGKAKSYSGGNICCTCDGDPLVSQKVDAVIVK